ncbi:hypothetical protein [Streptomyces sp. H10-C2]|uniref:hypothetical protein n=1 Tax=Streptomyces sp. H10-C2 TaxID=3046210 RepID=UPI0024BA55AB|nr:hypothetical protein [Streptomyces sp. H10-C2]
MERLGGDTRVGARDAEGDDAGPLLGGDGDRTSPPQARTVSMSWATRVVASSTSRDGGP